jgi:hypothetical protein
MKLAAITVGAAAGLAAPIIALPLLSANAGATMTFSVSPHSGARTATLTVTSVTPCPQGQTQAHVIAVSHPGSGDENVEVVDFPVTVDAQGDWTTQLDYFRDGPTGAWELQAGCGSPVDGNGYTPVGFNVQANTWYQNGFSPSPNPTVTTSPSPSASPSPEASPADAVGGDADFTG